MRQWEYVHIEASSLDAPELVKALNDAGVRGWELVSVAGSDRVGMDAVLAVLKRPIDPFDPPEDPVEGWKPDPSGRFEGRYWDGEVWTMRTTTAGQDHRDPPTRRTPARVEQ